ncbi:alkaline phosphatase D family protein [Kribbia dieselivorans]|uniref:alkaline phosphatase D family protein n=1 Tax=Kribbia dieselivorans TaxID=331526 RepID=UPI0008395242|nr:alkaline phosphatase D family protein [Kribbia dieselivorans]
MTPHDVESPAAADAHQVSRRHLLAGTAAGAALALLPGEIAHADAPGTFGGHPFTLGIASGDPDATSVVLWTRLAVRPLEIGGGLAPRKFPVHWQVAHDEQFAQIVREGTTFALPEQNHSVHVTVDGLEPDRWYFYRFRAGSELSGVGRTRTLPAPGAPTASFAVAQVSCQNWVTGWFTPYRDLAREDLDVAIHLGDYIYEGAITAVAPRQGTIDLPAEIRQPANTLERYRLRYALYKTDPDLQAAHAAVPFISVWDDHEVVNDYRGAVDLGTAQLARRAAGYRAWWENMPTRMPAPTGPDMRIYQRFVVGDLLQLDMLDGRQYRIADNHPTVSRLGDEQEAWLVDGIRGHDTRWNVVALGQQLGGVPTNSPTRNRIHRAYQDRGIQPVFLVGDMHWTIVQDLLLEVPNADSPVIGSQFMVTSITSTGDGPGNPATKAGWLKNPWIKYVDGYRGYISLRYTHAGVDAAQHNVDFITRPDAPGWVAQRFHIEAGRPGVQLV